MIYMVLLYFIADDINHEILSFHNAIFNKRSSKNIFTILIIVFY